MPPSSIDVRMTVFAASSSRCLPTGVDPVKEILRERGSRIIGRMTSSLLLVVTTLTTPAGRPACTRMSASARVDSGVSAAGLMTDVHPAAMAGPILRVPIAIGKFHGVMRMHGPTGCLATRKREPPAGAVMKPPSMRTASSANQRKNSAA